MLRSCMYVLLQYMAITCAKPAQKLVKRTYTAMTGEKHEDGDDGEDGEKKSKPPNLHKILRKKLNKLLEKKTDEYAVRLYNLPDSS